MAEAGDAPAMCVLGSFALRRNDDRTARDWFERAAALGHPSALTSLGWMTHDDGDDEAAIAILEDAAARNDATAMLLLGVLALSTSDAWLGALELRASAWTKPEAFEEFEIAGRAQTGDAIARQLQFEAGLPGVFGIVDSQRDPWLNRPDLVRTGLVGLVRAMNRFSRERGHAFSTYSIWWVRQNVTRRLTSGRGSARIAAEEIMVLGDAQLEVRLELGVDATGADDALRWWTAAAERELVAARDARAWLVDWQARAR